MIQFQIPTNAFLTTTTNAFCHVPYTGMGSAENPNYLNDLKNTYNSFSQHKLQSAVNELLNVLNEDLPQIYQLLGFDILQLFRKTVQKSIDKMHGLADGINYIRRHTNTYTTHLGERAPNYINDGAEPYPGITERTCDISADAAGKNILLIDDIYTPGVNIDEDAINALLNAGAKTLAFYAVGKVQRN